MNMPMDHKIETICRLRTEGLSYSDIALQTKISKSQVYTILKKHLPEPEVKSNVYLLDPKPEEMSKEVEQHSNNITKNEIEWKTIFRYCAWGFPVALLLPWLAATSAKAYAPDLGNFWAWVIALGVEVFTVTLAASIPRLSIPELTPAGIFKAIPNIFTIICFYGMLIAMCTYSFTLTNLSNTESKAQALNQIQASVSTAAAIGNLQREKESMLSIASTYEKNGWLGELRKVRETIAGINNKIDAEKINISKNNIPSIEAITDRNLVGKYLRIIVLFIITFCLHMIVKKENRDVK